MDHFEKELARMMRDTQDDTPFEARQSDRLQDGVRVRRRIRAAWLATGSALTIAGLGVGLAVLPNAFAADQPAAPQPRPAATAAPSPVPGPVTAHPVPAPAPVAGGVTSAPRAVPGPGAVPAPGGTAVAPAAVPGAPAAPGGAAVGPVPAVAAAGH